ncbi:hypothetical protein N9B46_04555 [Mariniblastus sp.]|nr:hypothetical protein [Mariniblastus sp.]MDA7926097.1 hypothetical protein [Mariniblastus sp.]MDB4381096.1 hypothetical protein [Mariniblastus sp.]
MAKIKLFTASFACLLLFSASNLGAQERDDRIREMERLYEQAVELAEDGNAEESKRLMDTVNEMRRAFRKGTANENDRSREQIKAKEVIAEFQKEMEYLRALLDRGVSEGEAREIREEFERLERAIHEKKKVLNREVDSHSRNLDRRNGREGDSQERLNEGREHQDHGQGDHGQGDHGQGDHGQGDHWREGREHDVERHQQHEWESRMHHLRAAAEHLHEADLHEVAEQIENQIRNLENERHGDESAGLEPLIHELMEKMEDFHRQIDDLREEVRRLKR